jgi:hypothetical protein
MEDVARIAGMVAQVAELYDSICNHIDVLYRVGHKRFELVEGSRFLKLGEFSIVLPKKLVKGTEIDLWSLDTVTCIVEWIDGKCDTVELSVCVDIDRSVLEILGNNRRIATIQLSGITPASVLFLYALEKYCRFVSELLERMRNRCDVLRKAVEMLGIIATSLEMLGGGKSGSQS